MITTIQIDKRVKMQLDKLKTSKKQTYEDVIVRLIKKDAEQKKKFKELMIEGCKEMYDEDLKICKEWECTLLDGLDGLEWK